MSIIEVTAEVTFQFDTDEIDWITTGDDAVEEVWQLLASGDLNPNDFTIGWTEEEA